MTTEDQKEKEYITLEDGKPRKSIAEASAESQLLYQAIVELAVDEILTYETMDRIIGREVRKARHFLMTAQNMARREKGFVYAMVRNTGIKRLSDHGVLDKHRNLHNSLRKKANRTIRDLACVDREGLSQADRTQVDLQRTFCALVSTVSKPKNVTKIEETVKETSNALAFQKTLELFKAG